jgi:hypothetical protein
MIRMTALIAMSVALAACTTPTGPQRFTDVYTLAFEMQAFTADGRNETWWATLEPQAQAEMNAALPTQAHASARASAPRSRAP